MNRIAQKLEDLQDSEELTLHTRNTITEAKREIERLEERVKEMSWKGSVDRQGGSFDDSELDPSRYW